MAMPTPPSRTPLLTERYAARIRGVLSCHDRVVIMGTLPEICHSQAMALFLGIRRIRLFDYTQWAQPLREEIREHAERLAAENGLAIEFIRNVDQFRKEARIKAIIAERGDHPGLVHIFSAMEGCRSFLPWHDKSTHKTFLKPTTSKCLHYYFYFIDEELGLCYVRVPTWAPFRLQFYFNGHNALAHRLRKKGIGFTLVENVFVDVEDWASAQKIADSLRPDRLHRRLDQLAASYCPVVQHFSSGYHWSIMQAEYATDIVFKDRSDLGPLYERLSRTAIHAVKAQDVAMFLGRKLDGRYLAELGSDFQTRIQGTRIKHHMREVSIKMYDKLGLVLRIETTVNDVSFFRHHRRVEHRDGSWEMKLAPLRKSIYSLPILRELMLAANRRYLEFISDLDDPSPGARNLDRISTPVRQGDRSYRGFNLFDRDDVDLLLAVVRGEFQISGFSNRRLRSVLPGRTGPQISRLLKRLWLHGLVRKVGHTYKYYLTRLGRRLVLTALKLKEALIIPTLARASA